MELHSGRMLAAILLFLFISSEMGRNAKGDASMCSTPSGKYKGLCNLDTNCATICSTEGFIQGKCHGLKCICSKTCAVKRTCKTPSAKYRGSCNRDSNCANVCRTEGGGFSGGRCHGFIPRKCYCTKIC